MFDSAPESVLRLTYWVEPDYESVHKSMQTRSGITTSTIEEMFRETLINIGSVVDVTVAPDLREHLHVHRRALVVGVGANSEIDVDAAAFENGDRTLDE
ncbi:hypothetical protein KXX57_002311 [Aspergillus fumigatus]|nr:hypothetical protein KXX42_001953 [Aspergillus fumigatus]KAH1547718.1 hypothetical protein KXX57_002311 [Aspergillus fumigatus]KAH2747329.1 hypothetical protein KXV94_005866 [Aspergillus fumigatus]KAH2911501.1 hypothetical protein KXW25_002441 [Aspergillus fumigatus]KAH3013962.1 hypothetical protein KXW60_008452 [Aspergillus fumigatus]